MALPAINYSTFQSIDQQQLKNTALNVLNSMLLGVGSPANWGADLGIEIEEFGLAKSSPFSKYVLDSEKVQRIDPESPWALSREKVQSLLKIPEYGFNLTLYRPFRTTPLLDIDTDNNMIHFGVNVTRTQDGAPIPNAEVNVTMFTSSLSADFTSHMGPYMTDSKGSFADGISVDPGILVAIAIMQITVGGMSTIVVDQDGWIDLSSFIRINTFDDTVRLSLRVDEKEWEEETGIPPANRWITDAWVYKSDERINIFEGRGQINWGKGKEFLDIVFPGLEALDPTAVIIKLEVVIPDSEDIDVPPEWKGNRVPVYICGALSFGAVDEILGFGYDMTIENTVAMIRRIVVIADMTYIVELGLWKN